MVVPPEIPKPGAGKSMYITCLNSEKTLASGECAIIAPCRGDIGRRLLPPSMPEVHEPIGVLTGVTPRGDWKSMWLNFPKVGMKT
jgi:hypothetical protein